MSRIGKMPIHLPAGVEVKISPENVITVKGPKGELSQKVNPAINVKLDDGILHLSVRLRAESTVLCMAFIVLWLPIW